MIVNDKRYVEPMLFDGDVYLDKDGELRMMIEVYGGEAVVFEGYRSYFVPVGERFYVVKYFFRNPTQEEMVFNLLDYVVRFFLFFLLLSGLVIILNLIRVCGGGIMPMRSCL